MRSFEKPLEFRLVYAGSIGRGRLFWQQCVLQCKWSAQIGGSSNRINDIAFWPSDILLTESNKQPLIPESHRATSVVVIGDVLLGADLVPV